MGRVDPGVGAVRLGAPVVRAVPELALRHARGSGGNLLRPGVPAGEEHPSVDGDARPDRHDLADFLFLRGRLEKRRPGTGRGRVASLLRDFRLAVSHDAVSRPQPDTLYG